MVVDFYKRAVQTRALRRHIDSASNRRACDRSDTRLNGAPTQVNGTIQFTTDEMLYDYQKVLIAACLMARPT